MLQFDSFSESGCNIIHFITTRNRVHLKDDNPYDNFNICDYTGDDESNIKKCREIIGGYMNIPVQNIVMPRQIHGTDVAIVNTPVMPGEFDAVITNKKGICIGVSTADCVPILLYDKQKQIIAAIHAGWRGLVNHIVTECIDRMKTTFGTDPLDIIAGIGPSIGPQSFEVGLEVVEKFSENGFSGIYISSKTEGKAYIDLWEATRLELISAGIAPHNIETAYMCTLKMSDKFFSARKLGIHSGRISTCLMLK